MSAFEKLGVFYLGRETDPGSGETSATPLLYEAKDLTTHAVCVGMTGSGKTGLCISLLEEAAIDRVPAIVIDPKGDLTNLLLTFPELRPEDFRPWIDESAAARKGMTPDEFAAKTARTWRDGLAEWGQDGERIRKLRESADLAVYTPGGSAGLPLRVLKSFDAPPPALIADTEAFQEKIEAAVTALLVLIGIDPDPVQSREHILLSNILDHTWRAGRSLDLAALIRETQSPPFDRVGVFDLESFFPSKERFALAMRLNNVLASPGFAAWMEGEPLNIERLLHTPAGKPRVSILSIAHLSDHERMFFVTLLLNEVVAWMRTQPGTSSLRALLYMDEVFGYFPPTAQPPSKKPMLTLLKQARAFGLGVVLATQNPVDLDYKGLSNTGTWFLGRLQTERDKKRVIEGLEGASLTSGQAFDRDRIERTLAGLGSRVFLMNNVHDDQPVIFRTRWAMSYLRGPMTRTQIAKLMAGRKGAAAVPADAAPAGGAVAPPPAPPEAGGERPVLPPGITEKFLPAGATGTGPLLYRPALLGQARLHYTKAPAAIDEWSDVQLLSLVLDDPGSDPWADADELRDVETAGEPSGDGRFAELPPTLTNTKSYTAWSKALAAHVYKERPLRIYRCAKLRVYSQPRETEGDFRARLGLRLREKRDLAAEKLKKRYDTKFAQLRERIRKDEQRIDREKGQLGQQKLQTVISVGATMLGALLGRKGGGLGTVGRASTAARGVGRIGREKEDMRRAQETLEANRAKLAELEGKFEEEIDALDETIDPATLELTEQLIRAKKTDMAVRPAELVWTPWRLRPDGTSAADYGV